MHRKGFIAIGAVLGIAMVWFVVRYAVYPAFTRTSVELPASCDTFAEGVHPPAHLAYDLSRVGTTIRIAEDDENLLVAKIDFGRAPYPSTAYLVRKRDGHALWSMQFQDDLISAAFADGVLIIYNDKLGYWIDERTGLPVRNFFTIDNYGGLSASDRPVLVESGVNRRRHQETSAVVTMIKRNGAVRSYHVIFNSVANGCFVEGLSPEGVSPL